MDPLVVVADVEAAIAAWHTPLSAFADKDRLAAI